MTTWAYKVFCNNKTINLPENGTNFFKQIIRMKRNQTYIGNKPYWLCQDLGRILGYISKEEFNRLVTLTRYDYYKILDPKITREEHFIPFVWWEGKKLARDFKLSREACLSILLKEEEEKGTCREAIERYFISDSCLYSFDNQDKLQSRRERVYDSLVYKNDRLIYLISEICPKETIWKNIFTGLYGTSDLDVIKSKKGDTPETTDFYSCMGLTELSTHILLTKEMIKYIMKNGSKNISLAATRISEGVKDYIETATHIKLIDLPFEPKIQLPEDKKDEKLLLK